MAREKLTSQQEVFVQELIQGKTQREAYRVAYPNSVNWKDGSVDSEASRLKSLPKVSTRYEELLKQQQEEIIRSNVWDITQATKILKVLMEKGIEELELEVSPAMLNAITRIVQELNSVYSINTDYSERDELSKVDKILNEIFEGD